MSVDMVRARLANYGAQSSQEEENALKEIMQEIILHALAKNSFFSKAAFQGGTALRILHGLQRFSEDLDFALITPDSKFSWGELGNSIRNELALYGIQVEEKNKKQIESSAVKNMILKETALARFLEINPIAGSRKKLLIKIEIDANPPFGAECETKYVLFPNAFMVNAHTLESSFAGKSHALLCRKYIKGRDWYDFVWYVSRNIKPNFMFLENALKQSGPWKDHNDLHVDLQFYKTELRKKISSINWDDVKRDSLPFLKRLDTEALSLWNKNFFDQLVDKIL